jgi:hypothetical protein
MGSTTDLHGRQWRKSSYSGSQGGECLEVANAGAQVAIRDSKDVHGPQLAFSTAAFGTFLTAVTEGRLAG